EHGARPRPSIWARARVRQHRPMEATRAALPAASLSRTPPRLCDTLERSHTLGMVVADRLLSQDAVRAIIQHLRTARPHFAYKTLRPGERETTLEEKLARTEDVLRADPALFLQRWGGELSDPLLRLFEPLQGVRACVRAVSPSRVRARAETP